MKREIIDASQLELNEKVVSIKRVTKVVKVTCLQSFQQAMPSQKANAWLKSF